jgi:phenylacetate-CoA ligase
MNPALDEPGYRYPLALPVLDPAQVQPLLAELMRREDWSRTVLLDFQRQRLARVLRGAAAASPHYRRVIGPAVADGASLADLPALTKRELMDGWDRIVTDPRLRLRDVERHLDSPRAGTLILDRYRAYATGGTTGERAVVVYDRPGWLQTIANMLRLLRTLGATPEARTMGIGAPTPLHITNRAFAELRGGRSDVPRLSVLTPLPELVEALNRYQPEVIFTYPSFIRRLAEEQDRGRLAIRPARFVSTAEVLTDHVRLLAGETWGARVFNGYGTTEAGMLGTECDLAAGVHIAEDMVVVESVDEANRPVAPGTPGAKVLVTTLYDTPLPLIRYEISDIVAMQADPCPCGRPYQRLASLDGRREDMLTLAAPDGGQLRLHAGRLRGSLDGVPGLRQYQLVQRSADSILVRITVRDGSEPGDVAVGARSAIEHQLRRAGARPGPLDIEVVDAIERRGAAAKECLVSSV